LFCLALASLHLCIVIPAFLAGRWEGYMSLIFAMFFVVVGVITWFARYEMSILVSKQIVRTRLGVGPMKFDKIYPFADVRGVRLTQLDHLPASESRIEILCGNDDIEVPPTAVPRQEALMLALAIGVPLTKVMPSIPPAERSPSDSPAN
jgi:hypothetical protein